VTFIKPILDISNTQLEERKHVARYWSINTAATAVPLSAHPSPLVITTKLAAAISEGPLFGGGGFCRPSTAPVVNYLFYWITYLFVYLLI